MSIVVALIITLILLAKFAGNKANESYYRRESQKNLDEIWDRKMAFEAKYGDYPMQDAVQREVSARSDNAIRMTKKIREEVGIEPTSTMVCLGIMAESCKIPSKFLRGPISNLVMHDKYTSYEEAEKDMIDQCKFMKWYNKTLIEHGMDDDELYYVPVSEVLKKVSNPTYRFNEIKVSMMTPQRCGGFYWQSTKGFLPDFHGCNAFVGSL